MHWSIIAGLVICLLPMIELSAYSAKGGNQIHHQIQRRLAAGEKENQLIYEQSPYLLQHAFNPVDWYPWGEEALQKAKNEDKPIFLSIGYSTCHWCHVMAHESLATAYVCFDFTCKMLVTDPVPLKCNWKS